MNNEDLFIKSNLPKPLTKLEVYELLDKIKQGDKEAETKLIEHNIRLVLHEVSKRFNTVQYDKKDLVSIGNIGLIKAIESFDTSKKVEFATYATRCIDNEILMFLRKLKKYDDVISLDGVINFDKDGNELTLADTLSDDTDIVEECVENETHHIVREIVKDLPERDKQIIMLYFGFYDDEHYSQKEISDMLSLSQSYVSRLVTGSVKKISKKLEEKGIIDLSKKQVLNEKKQTKKEGVKKMAKLQTIYEYFNSYTKEQVDAMLKKLSEEEKALITLRYGNDLNSPISGKLNKDEINAFYGRLVPKMKKMLLNPNKEIKIRNKKTVSTNDDTNITNNKNQKKKQFETAKTTLENKAVETGESALINSSTDSITKEDYIKMLELTRTPSFAKMLKTYSPKEAMIASLKLGHIDGKSFSTAAISEFLEVEQQEVIDTTKKILLAYKDKMNQMIDGAIQVVTQEKEATFTLRIKK